MLIDGQPKSILHPAPNGGRGTKTLTELFL